MCDVVLFNIAIQCLKILTLTSNACVLLLCLAGLLCCFDLLRISKRNVVNKATSVSLLYALFWPFQADSKPK
jgi:hypothetical protein